MSTPIPTRIQLPLPKSTCMHNAKRVPLGHFIYGATKVIKSTPPPVDKTMHAAEYSLDLYGSRGCYQWNIFQKIYSVTWRVRSVADIQFSSRNSTEIDLHIYSEAKS